eukprot:scaffold27185_cov97-Isochrysis_galbana.AAC.8
MGCSESWVAYLARCVRQRRYRKVPPIGWGSNHNLFVDAAGRLLECREGAAVGHGDAEASHLLPTLVAAKAGARCGAWLPDGIIASPSAGMAGSAHGVHKLLRAAGPPLQAYQACASASGESRERMLPRHGFY